VKKTLRTTSLKNFLISVSTWIGTKKGRIYIKGAPFNGAPAFWVGQLPQTVAQTKRFMNIISTKKFSSTTFPLQRVGKGSRITAT